MGVEAFRPELPVARLDEGVIRRHALQAVLKLTVVRPNSPRVPGKDTERKLGVFWLMKLGMRADRAFGG